jgi:hypothetical protein
MEEVDDEVHIIQQNPTPLWQPLHVVSGRASVLSQPFLDMLTQRPNMGIGRPTGDHEIVGHVRYPIETEDDDVVRFVVQQYRGRPLDEIRDSRRLRVWPCRR